MYRIVPDYLLFSGQCYTVDWRPWWWPFWITQFCAKTIKEAEDHITYMSQPPRYRRG